jgi:Protein of unknown function (DUF3829)
MKSYGSSLGLGLLVLTPLVLAVGVSCKKEEPPKPDPAAAQPASASPPTPPNRHPPRGPGARMDPQVNKEHRIDYCYYGTFSLRQARDAYLASLGKDEPSAKKIPSLGAPALPAPPGAPSATPATTPAAKPPAPATPSAKPTAGPTLPPSIDRRQDPSIRLPHERNARSCTAALALKEPAMGDVDTQMALYAPFAVELAKDITAAQTYYQQQDYTKDSFARGKELDKKLRDEFAKLDDLSEKLGAAIAAYHKEHPADPSKMEEGEKTARAAIDAARDVFMLVVTKKADGDAWKTAVEKLDKSAEALKSFSDGHPADVWGKMVGATLDALVKTVKGAKITPDKTLDGDSYLALINNFTSLLDSRLRAGTRSSMTHPPLLPNVPGPNAPQPPP